MLLVAGPRVELDRSVTSRSSPDERARRAETGPRMAMLRVMMAMDDRDLQRATTVAVVWFVRERGTESWLR